jgi:hypothetical protein
MIVWVLDDDQGPGDTGSLVQVVDMARNVVAFVGQNENSALREGSLWQMRCLERFGLTGHVIDAFEPSWSARLNELLREGVVFGWGHAGIGSTLTFGPNKGWDAIGVPFVAVLSDPPCWLPQSHRPESRGVVLGYVFDEWLDVQRRFIKAPNVCGRVPACIPSNEDRDRIPWSARSHRMVFVKTGDAPAPRREAWKWLPKRMRAILEDAADEACRHGTMGLTDLLLGCLTAHGLFVEEHLDMLFALMLELDIYVRAERSTRIAQALSRLPAVIIGRGWDHLDRTHAKATFMPSVDASRLPDLMADTQFVVNATPNFGSGVHERVLLAFAARACAVSDQNDYSRANFDSLPTFFGLDWHTDDLADRLADIWAIKDDLGPATDAALHRLETNHSPIMMMQALLELAELGLLAMKNSDDRAVP